MEVEVEVEHQSSEPSSLFSAPDDQPGSKKLSLQVEQVDGTVEERWVPRTKNRS